MRASTIDMLRRYGYLAAIIVLAISNISVSATARAATILVANTSYNTINKFAPDGTNLGYFANSDGLGGPTGMIFDANGDLLVANSGLNTINKFAPDGTNLGYFANSDGLGGPSFFVIVPEPSVLTMIGIAALALALAGWVQRSRSFPG